MDKSLYKGVVVFMIQGLKKTVPVVVRASEVTVSGQWLASELSYCLSSLENAGFKVRAIVGDNHSANVSAFNYLLKNHPSDDPHAIQHPGHQTKTYLFFDNVHLVKNIGNNLLNVKKFVFPAMSFTLQGEVVASCESGYIRWQDFRDIFQEDEKQKANLRKAPKLTHNSLHLGNNKQNVAILHETTIAACKSYFPARKDVIAFLTLFSVWWMIVNSKKRFHPNKLGNAVVQNDGKIEFLLSFADWIENWGLTAGFTFCFSKQTCSALVRTLRGQANLI